MNQINAAAPCGPPPLPASFPLLSTYTFEQHCPAAYLTTAELDGGVAAMQVVLQ